MKAGARLQENVAVTGPMLDERTGRVIGVTARELKQPENNFSSRVVIAADGNSSRLSVSMGLHKRDDRPLGVAVRTYYTSPRHDDEYLEAWLDLWDGKSLLPGYGWIFGMGDGTSNVGLGLLNTSEAFGKIDYKVLLRKWLAAMPAEWGFTEEQPDAAGARSRAADGLQPDAALHPRPAAGGDAGGMVNPFNGEGIAYAMESGRARRAHDRAGARPADRGRYRTSAAGATRSRSSRTMAATTLWAGHS